MATTAGRVPWAVRVVSAPMVWLERSRGWKRRLLVLLYLLIVLIVGLFGYRAMGIAKLPDVGDPFDVAEFSASVRIPDERNAAPLYRDARKALIDQTRNQKALAQWNADAKWATANPATRAWVVAARPALERWRQGTERPEASWIVPEEATVEGSRFPDANDMLFVTLARLESSRLEEEGDFAGAWRWHRAVLRFAQHFSSNTIMDRRTMGSYILQYGSDQISTWAADPKVPPEALRGAIRDVEEVIAMTPPSSQTLKFHYVALMNSLDDLPRLTRMSSEEMTYPYEEWTHWYWGYWFLKHEPARTRRIARLAFANRLAWCDVPQAERPAQVGNADRGPAWIFYQPDPSAPRSARRLPPAEMFAWIESSMFARSFIPAFVWFEPNAEADRRRLSILSIKIAENLYQQEHGKEPQSPQALVDAGYLKILPAEYRESKAKEE